MHIGHYTNFYHPIVNGVVHSVSSYRHSLTALGHNVFIFAQQASNYVDEEPFIFRYPALPVPRQIDIRAAIPIAPHIDWILPSLKLDVIHTHHPILLGQVAVNKSAELDVPLVFTFHTRYRDYTHYVPIPQDLVQDFVKTAIDSWLGEFMEHCHHIIVPSQSMAKTLEEGYGLSEHVTTIPTGIDLQPYRDADGQAERARRGWQHDCVLISVGRLAPEKNMTTLLQAAAQALKTHPSLRVVLVGDGPYRKKLERLTESLNIRSRVEFLGKVPFEQIPVLLKAADLFGFASVTETQGLVTMEALAAGLPVAAVDAIGTRDVVTNNVEGILTENDSGALSNAITTILEHPEQHANYRQAAYNKARSFDIMRLTQMMVEVYESAIETHRAGERVKLKKPKLFDIDWKFIPSLHDN